MRKKAVQATAVILRTEGKGASRLRVLKLLIIAERKCLQQTGHTMLGGKFCIMKHGPLHSAVYALIKGEHPEEAKWSRYIVRDGPRDLRLSSEPSMGELSPFEVQLLNAIVEKHIHMSDYDLAEITHEFGEIKDNRPTDDTSIPLSLEDIVRAACPVDIQEEIIEDLRDKACL